MVMFSEGSSFSYPDYIDYQAQTGTVFEGGIAAHFPLVPASIGGKGEPERTWGQAVSGNFFPILGLNMARGRSILPNDDEVVGRDHAVVHVDIPVIRNVGYLIGGRLLHPGDSLAVPDLAVEVLALPASAPWMALKEAVEFFRAVNPSIAIPIHEKMLANPAMVYSLLERLGPTGARWIDLDDGRTEDL